MSPVIGLGQSDAKNNKERDTQHRQKQVSLGQPWPVALSLSAFTLADAELPRWLPADRGVWRDRWHRAGHCHGHQRRRCQPQHGVPSPVLSLVMTFFNARLGYNAHALMDPIEFQEPIRRYFQKKRFKNFISDYASCKTILDVGGGRHMWEALGRSSGVTILNILPPPDTGGFTYVRASACEIPFPDKSFDLAFSNSAIEHAGSEENQFKFAGEMMRVGKRIYCQTPSRLFPIDPHLTTPFLHWLPNSWLTPRFLRYFTLNGWLLRKPYQYDVTWISKRKLQKMFPGCKIATERFLLMPKSFTVTN